MKYFIWPFCGVTGLGYMIFTARNRRGLPCDINYGTYFPACFYVIEFWNAFFQVVFNMSICQRALAGLVEGIGRKRIAGFFNSSLLYLLNV